jgi:hypothetical protein
MSNQREQYHSYKSTEKINDDDEDGTNHDMNEGSGDLSSWEYLTKQYDHAHWMDDSTTPATKNRAITKAAVGSMDHPTSIRGLAEMGNVQLQLPDNETFATSTEEQQLPTMSNSASYPDLALQTRDYRFQHPPPMRNQPVYLQHNPMVVGPFTTNLPRPQQYFYPTLSNPPKSWSYPMMMNHLVGTAPTASTTATPPFTMFPPPPQEYSNQPWVQSQPPVPMSEYHTTQLAQSLSQHQQQHNHHQQPQQNQPQHQHQQHHQQQYETTSEEPYSHQHEHMNVEPLQPHASRFHERLTLATAPIQAAHQMFPTSSVSKNYFEPKPIRPGHMESIHTNATTKVSASKQSLMSSYSKKRASSGRSGSAKRTTFATDPTGSATMTSIPGSEDGIREQNTKPSSVFIRAKKRAPSHRTRTSRSPITKDKGTAASEASIPQDEGAGEGNNDGRASPNDDPNDEVYDLELPSFTQKVVPPYQQQNNVRLLLKPLTPYNYFYRDERENMVHNFTKEGDPLPPPVCDFATTKMHALLYQHWYIDPVKQKRAHRKSHGKVSFETLSKTIAQRWHNLPNEGRLFYRNTSLLDGMYYQNELFKIEPSKSTSFTAKSDDS